MIYVSCNDISHDIGFVRCYCCYLLCHIFTAQVFTGYLMLEGILTQGVNVTSNDTLLLFVISFMQGTYIYVPEANDVSMVYVLQLLCSFILWYM